MSVRTDNEQILCKVLNIIGYNEINIDELEDRLRIQKLVYLIQSYGLSLCYGYIWYVRGPYSPELTQTVYGIGENPHIFSKVEDVKLKDNNEIENRLASFMSIIGDKLHDNQYLEILSSMHYINKVMHNGKGSKKRVEFNLYKAKPSLRMLRDIDIIVSDAYDKLKYFN
jgi:uncharacterized protein YwgA